MKALIALTEALSWEDPSSQIETIPIDTVLNGKFASHSAHHFSKNSQ